MKRLSKITFLFGLISLGIALYAYNVKEFETNPDLIRDVFCIGSAIVYFILNICIHFLSNALYKTTELKWFMYCKRLFGYTTILCASNIYDEFRDDNTSVNVSEIIAFILATFYTIWIFLEPAIKRIAHKLKLLIFTYIKKWFIGK